MFNLIDIEYDDITSPTSLVLSPDQLNLYVCSDLDSSLYVYGRDPVSGDLSPLEVLRDRIDGTTGLRGARSVTVSPDGQHVYVVGAYGSIVTFARAANGMLGQPVDVIVDTSTPFVENPRRLSGASCVLVSPDGAFAYVSSSHLRGVLVYERDSNSGRLTFVSSIAQVDVGHGTIGPIRWMDISPDGQHIYTVTQDNNSPLATFSRDFRTGELTHVRTYDGTNDFQQLFRFLSIIVSPDGENVYTSGNGKIVAFARDISTGNLSLLGAASGIGETREIIQAQRLAISPNGRFLYKAGISGRFLGPGVFRRLEDGMIEPLSLDQVGDGYSEVTAIAISTNGSHMYGIGENVVEFDLDVELGVPSRRFPPADPLVGEPYGLRFTKSIAIPNDGLSLYAIAEVDRTIASFERDSATGELSFVNALPLNSDEFDCQYRALTIAPDGLNVYAGLPCRTGIINFRRDPESSRLTPVQEIGNDNAPLGGRVGTVDLLVSPDGYHVYLLTDTPGNSPIQVYSRNDGDGHLVPMLDATKDLDFDASYGRFTMSPDGRHLYTKEGRAGKSINILSRNANSGRIVLEQVFEHESLSISGGLCLSDDGSVLYVANGINLLVLRRNELTGQLQFQESLETNGGLTDVTPIPHRQLIVAHSEFGINVFEKADEGGYFGPLVLDNQYIHQLNNLSGISSIITSLDGRHLYASATGDAPGATTGLWDASLIAAFEIGHFAHVRGKLTDITSGEAIPCASIELVNEDSVTIDVIPTDQNGEFYFVRMPAGEYSIRAFSSGYQERISEFSLGSAVDVTIVNLELAPTGEAANIIGFVRDSESNGALVSAKVEAFYQNELREYTVTCEDGSFQFRLPDELREHTVKLRFSLPGFAAETLEIMVPLSGESDASVMLQRGSGGTASIRGVVYGRLDIGSDKQVIRDAQVTVRGYTSITHVTDPGGRYSFESVVPGEYRLDVSAPGYIGAHTKCEVIGSEVNEFSFILNRIPEIGKGTADLDHNGRVDSIDLQYAVNEIIRFDFNTPFVEITGDGRWSAEDIQYVILAILSGG